MNYTVTVIYENGTDVTYDNLNYAELNELILTFTEIVCLFIRRGVE